MLNLFGLVRMPLFYSCCWGAFSDFSNLSFSALLDERGSSFTSNHAGFALKQSVIYHHYARPLGNCTCETIRSDCTVAHPTRRNRSD